MSAAVKSVPCLSAFEQKTKQPTTAELRRTLGPAADAWDALAEHISTTYSATVQQWNFSGAKFGWSMRLGTAKRVILYLIPQRGSFLVGIVLGGKAVAAAQRADLPTAIIEAIAQAPRYAEGTGIRVPVWSVSDLPAIEKLAALKMSTT